MNGDGVALPEAGESRRSAWAWVGYHRLAVKSRIVSGHKSAPSKHEVKCTIGPLRKRDSDEGDKLDSLHVTRVSSLTESDQLLGYNVFLWLRFRIGHSLDVILT